MLPEGVTKIGGDAFVNCCDLTSITLPESVREIPRRAFWNNPALTIYAPAGSYAEEYAKKNHIPFAAI